MGSAPTVDQYHFDGWDLPTKYGWMHSGPGVQAATMAQDAVREMSERLIASGNLVRGLLGGAQWAGAAAMAAGEAMQRGAGQITQTAAETATAKRCVTELGESFAATQHRVPSPNEVPTGLGDRFLHSAAEGFNALSPFDVQSPLHAAMEQRRELDQQANLALTDHMTTSRDRVEALPAVMAPAPMTVTTQSAAVSGGGVGQPSGAVPVAAGAGGAPSSTPTAGWGGVSAPPPTGATSPGPGVGGAPFPPVAGPVSTGPTGTPGGPASGSRSSGPGAFGPGASGSGAFGPTGAGHGTGGRALGPHSGGPHSGGRAGGAAGRGAGFGARAGAGDGVSGRGAPRLDDTAGGTTPGPRSGGPGGVGAGGSGAGRAGASSFLQPPVGGRGSGDDDTEHKDRYAQHADHIVGELPLVAPAVIGELPEEEARRLREGR